MSQVEPDKTPRERAEDFIRLLVPDWRPTRQQGLWAIRIGIVLGLLVAIGYSYGITLWDWAKLLIVPAVIAAGGLWFNTQQKEREQRTAERRAQDDTLQAYLDEMSHLLTDKELHRAQLGDSLSTVARARTLTVLERLDSVRKRSVLQFLYESGLIYKERTLLNEADLIERRHNIVRLNLASLIGADLSFAYLREADLSETNMRGADLRRADLWGADLSRANLSGANLIGAELIGAKLSGTNLIGANLSGANLIRATLSQVYLSEANMRGADLSGANMRVVDLSRADLSSAKGVTNEQLSAYISLEGATMPNGQKYEDWLKSQENGKNE